MTKLAKVENAVNSLYQAKHKKRDEWADWLYQEHIFAVAQEGEALAKQFGANLEPVVAASLLHDIADAVMSRFDPRHQDESLKIAREILTESGFEPAEIKLVIEDILPKHSCSKELPDSLEGKVMATADAFTHIASDFYEKSIELMKQEQRPITQIKDWAVSKLEKDFYRKIFFDEIRDKLESRYKLLRSRFEKIA